MKLPLHTGRGATPLDREQTVFVTAFKPNPKLDLMGMDAHLEAAVNSLVVAIKNRFGPEFSNLVVDSNRSAFHRTGEISISLKLDQTQSLGDKLLRFWYRLTGDKRHLCRPWCAALEMEDSQAEAFSAFLAEMCSSLNLELERLEPERLMYPEGVERCPHEFPRNRPLQYRFEIADHTPFLLAA